MRKEINLKYLGEIDKVHSLSTSLFQNVSSFFKGLDISSKRNKIFRNKENNEEKINPVEIKKNKI